MIPIMIIRETLYRSVMNTRTNHACDGYFIYDLDRPADTDQSHLEAFAIDLTN